ncbi:uncharacterized protein LOC123551554 [Mercenaria mercenaria]|uniref:uncharacterized protein LOC123551554 n=1 Tax=Mercenaria mercenaria TaxID=6596 RepID=UPI00234F83F2|nr:uncharacterized protein LOC123551554 [Mercenaria mercenaria]XP_045196521.2 uncharacterized protein LOC123551554 [Mercenaria mercenaria]XP_053397016.1 uncharacterized protein LOC123551554 [Mercenaria mercenaria]
MSTVSASEVTIRQNKKEDITFLLQFVEEEGWDWSMYDHLSHTRLDPNYLLVAEDKSGEPVGFCAVTKSAPDTVYVSSFIVRKDLRRSGIGRALWKAMVQRAGNQNIALDAVKGMVDWYKKNGLQFQTFRTFYHIFTITDDMKKSYASNYETIALSEEMWPALLAYDQYVYPNFDRTAILRAWFSGEDVHVAVAMDAGKIVGYGSIHKKPNNEYGLRNVFGDNEDVIQALLHDMVSGLQKGAVVHFFLLDEKRLPTYIKHSVKYEEAPVRMYSKVRIETNTARMWIATAHLI